MSQINERVFILYGTVYDYNSDNILEYMSVSKEGRLEEIAKEVKRLFSTFNENNPYFVNHLSTKLFIKGKNDYSFLRYDNFMGYHFSDPLNNPLSYEVYKEFMKLYRLQ
jgi:hypothetical protein